MMIGQYTKCGLVWFGLFTHIFCVPSMLCGVLCGVEVVTGGIGDVDDAGVGTIVMEMVDVGSDSVE